MARTVLTLNNKELYTMDKIKAFFENKVTKIISWIVLAIAVVFLVLGGVTQETISSGIALVIGVVGAVAALIAFISERAKK